tara:strand:+ start:5482 stop:7695 length:2214 start_codon:yes stop_codon:yes gene_type:complete
MKKIILTFFSFLVFLLLGVTLFLSTKGYETDRFNTFLSQEINQTQPDLEINFNKIKIKFDIKKVNLFLSTKNPNINYKKINLPITELKIYINFFSIFSNEIEVEQVITKAKDIQIEDLKKLIVGIKPSNFKSFVLNNVSEGTFNSNFYLDFKKKFQLESYKVDGTLNKTNISFNKDIKLNNTSFNFIANDSLFIINSIIADFKEIEITNGNLKIENKENLIIEGSLNTKIPKITNTDIKSIIPESKTNSSFFDNKILIKGNLLNQFNLEFSKNLELKNFNYNLTGSLKETDIKFNKDLDIAFFEQKLNQLNLKETNIKFELNKQNKNSVSLEGLFSLNGKDKYEKYKLKNSFSKNKSNFDINFDINEEIFIKIINYKKDISKVGNIEANFEILKDKIHIKNFVYKEDKSSISLENVKINKKNQLESFKNIKVRTYQDSKENNNLEIVFGKKISVKGKSFDSSNLIKELSDDNKTNTFNKINKEISISFEDIITKLKAPLKNFNLIGKIEKGKFVKLSSKSEFSANEFLDISLKKNPNNNKKILEIYSGQAKPLLSDFDFFKGLEGGQLLFTSIFDENSSSSNLQIKNFKVLNAPAFAKLLALADLSGLAVLLSGEGLSFESLEIKFTDDDEVRKIGEIYAVGPSITILMDGYIENKTGLTSLRGTMVPAKEINKLISKIPVIGDILIGKEIGEGVFGVSFKIKGLPGKTKTTVNPLKTLTPRFITRALERKKKENEK